MKDGGSDGQQRISTTWMARSIKLAGTMAKIATSRKSRNPAATGAELYNRLGELKGMMLKVGQMASYIEGSLPLAMQASLAKLQDSAPPMAPEIADRVVAEELGRPPAEVFATWSSTPVSAASIGQVHRATRPDGTHVAVTVQYPEVAAAMTGDLRGLNMILSLAGAAYPGLDAKAIKDELRTHLLAECDYRQEAASQEFFRALYAADPRVEVPRVFPNFSGGRVLTTEWAHGRRFADFLASSSPEARNAAGEAIFWFAFHSIFKHGLFNCDPHPGNYMFGSDGRVVFLDFGCVKRFEPGFVQTWRDMIAAGIAGQRRRFDELVVSSGVARPGAKLNLDYHYQMCLELYRPFLTDRPFRFTADYVRTMSEAVGAKNPNKRKLAMPRDFIFINRLQWGLYSVLSALGAEANFHQLFLELADLAPTGPRPVASITPPTADDAGASA